MAQDKDYQNAIKKSNALRGQQNSILSSSTILMAAQNTIFAIANTIKIISLTIQTKLLKKKVESTAATIAETGAENANTKAKAQNALATKALKEKEKELIAVRAAAQATNPVGLALTAIAATVTAATIGIKAWKKHKQAASDSVKKIKELSNEIYTLNKNSLSLETTIKEFDKLDNKILKVTEDYKQMGEALDSAADKLTEKQRKIYDSLSSDKSRREYLETALKENRDQIEKDQEKILESINTSKGQKALTGKSSDDILVQDALYAYNNQKLYKAIDDIKDLSDEQKTAIESVGQTILENLSPTEAYAAANRNAAASLTEVLKNNSNLVNTLTNSDALLADQVDAYKQLSYTLTGDVRTAFQSAYSQFGFFAEFGEEVVKTMDALGFKAESINNMAEAIQNLGYSVDKSKDKFKAFMTSVAQGADLGSAIRDNFGEVLKQYEQNSEEWQNAYNTILNAYEKRLELVY